MLLEWTHAFTLINKKFPFGLKYMLFCVSSCFNFETAVKRGIEICMYLWSVVRWNVLIVIVFTALYHPKLRIQSACMLIPEHMDAQTFSQNIHSVSLATSFITIILFYIVFRYKQFSQPIQVIHASKDSTKSHHVSILLATDVDDVAVQFVCVVYILMSEYRNRRKVWFRCERKSVC